jgi:hypothetical protein
VQSVYAHKRKAYKQRQCFHLVLNTIFTTRLPNFSIAINVDKSRVKHHVYPEINNSYSTRKTKRIAKLINLPMQHENIRKASKVYRT